MDLLVKSFKAPHTTLSRAYPLITELITYATVLYYARERKALDPIIPVLRYIKR